MFLNTHISIRSRTRVLCGRSLISTLWFFLLLVILHSIVWLTVTPVDLEVGEPLKVLVTSFVRNLNKSTHHSLTSINMRLRTVHNLLLRRHPSKGSWRSTNTHQSHLKSSVSLGGPSTFTSSEELTDDIEDWLVKMTWGTCEWDNVYITGIVNWRKMVKDSGTGREHWCNFPPNQEEHGEFSVPFLHHNRKRTEEY